MSAQHRVPYQGRAQTANWIAELCVNVSPLVAIVAMGCLLIFGLVVVIKARPEDLPKIFGNFTRWFGK